ncbi:MAG: putative Zn-dependent hydrolases of the beta-lactamase fold protein [Candidatus Moranbacteria bacterium GW2011_GWF2_36_839]|nr:MAG: putative Zn-dependent hydrolases of the beta-lactamase fold protein [Candidatus Moranbacteria bacterium GW2011_GWF1_36_78]KKQ16749.1 MAG: putative Zn-dependent hydrolases of the beta-lactamase fold protein [Candidatus Moranbacteria bacterium GW2011_GWF2_36_839]HAT74262.1 MBL fold metallo-hydrolase [Candidatus Moranbacteria bacterium]HBY11370.1 MBL fold metallo-hydrolase [Candidatus Moranbacteria bacterium]
MIIQYYGHSCFKITTKPAGRGKDDVAVFFDPFDKSVGLRPPQGQADLVLVSHNHADHNNVEALKGEPYVIDIPGEYSAKGANIIGIASYHDDKNGAERGENTIFVLEAEDLRICHLGDLGTDLSEKQLEKINGIDILMIPIGGGNYTIDGKKAVDIIKKIEPKIIIPMHYKIKGSTVDIDDEKVFCNEIGNCPKEKVSKINIKKKDLEEKEMEVVLMDIE